MHMLTDRDLHSLEEYSNIRPHFRQQVMTHKKNRQVTLGEHITLYFEDRLTIQYQVQEMLRIERIFEANAIAEELSAYNPLIPDGSNWKATMMIEYTDVAERKIALEKMTGIEDKIYLKIAEYDKNYAISNEDIARSTENKTSAVHFLRFQLTDTVVAAIKQGAVIQIGIDHSVYPCAITMPENIRQSLLSDLH